MVVDVLAKVRARRSGQGDRYADDYADLSPWQQLATHYRVTVLLLHHDRKAEAADFVDAVSGTHGVAGSADSVLRLTRARMESYGVLSLTGRDVPEHEVSLRRVGPVWQHHDGPLPDPNLGDRSAAIVGLAANHPAESEPPTSSPPTRACPATTPASTSTASPTAIG